MWTNILSGKSKRNQYWHFIRLLNTNSIWKIMSHKFLFDSIFAAVGVYKIEDPLFEEDGEEEEGNADVVLIFIWPDIREYTAV